MPLMRRALLLPALLLVASAAAAQAVTHVNAPVVPTPGAGFSAGLVKDPRIAAVLADIAPARIRYTDSVLVSFGTRHTMSDTTSETRGIGAARRFLYSELRAFSRDCGGCLVVEYDPHDATISRFRDRPVARVVNVLAWLPGRDTTRVVVIGGHYDSCVCSVDAADATSDAPGADDDGSGTSAVIELARVMSKRFPKGFDATVVFALYAAEEQGLLGSTGLAKRLHDDKKTVVASLTDDIVGNVVADDGHTDSTSIRLYAVDSIPSRSGELARYVWGMGTIYTPKFEVRPSFRLDRIGRGGDHSPFHRMGDPGLRFSERLENLKRQHLPTDDLANVNFGYVANVARLNLATVASLASAPNPVDSVVQRRDRASGGQKWQISWKPVSGAARYEVLFRQTTSPTWTQVYDPGTATTFLLDEQLDDGWAAVRAVGADGHLSLTTVAGSGAGAPRPAAVPAPAPTPPPPAPAP
ncbi:MAG: M28 family peptidase [Gemmatimonadetes bacterium]|nr:M28 family peptidase [Gemmatimonadota bacterium]